jgi:predicted nucleic acid-binding protein
MVIVNSAPILALHEIGRLGILKEVFGEIVIPDAVRREVTVKDANTLEGYEWIHVALVADSAMKGLFTSALHDGEVEVILLAKEYNESLVVLDDKLARRHAKYLGLTVTGTAGVLVLAKSKGIIGAVKPVLDELIKTGLFISDDIYREVLRLASE